MKSQVVNVSSETRIQRLLKGNKRSDLLKTIRLNEDTKKLKDVAKWRHPFADIYLLIKHYVCHYH